jgi:hypothetical protein
MGKTLASALVDRLMHHAHVIVTDGDSIRLADALAGRGWCLSPAERRGPTMTVRGEFPRPSPGTPGGRPRGLPVAIRGAIPWPPMGRSPWPLTVLLCARC